MNSPDNEIEYFEQSLLDNKNSMQNLLTDLASLLGSNRFWGVVGTSAAIVLTAPDFATNAWFVNLGKFLGLVFGGATVVGTLDRVSSQNTTPSVVTPVVTGTKV